MKKGWLVGTSQPLFLLGINILLKGKTHISIGRLENSIRQLENSIGRLEIRSPPVDFFTPDVDFSTLIVLSPPYGSFFSIDRNAFSTIVLTNTKERYRNSYAPFYDMIK